MKRINVIFFAMFILLSNQVEAATYKAAPSCQDWFGVNENTKNTNRYWLIAYLSGLNVMNYQHMLENKGQAVDVIKNISNDRFFTFVDRFCRDKPQEDLAMAGTAAFYYFERNR